MTERADERGDATQRRRREEGQAVTAVAVTTMLLVMGAALWMIYPFGRGESELSKLKSATDAAALAGAQSVVSEAWTNVEVSLNSKAIAWFCGDGQSRAHEFAQKNDATVTSYCYFPLADRVEVDAKTDYVTATKKVESAHSVARLGRRLGPCLPDEPLEPTAAGYEAMATCGEVHVRIFVPPSTHPLKLLTTPEELKAMFKVRLDS